MYLLLVLQIITISPTPQYNWSMVGMFETENVCKTVGIAMGEKRAPGVAAILCVPTKEMKGDV